MKSYQYTRDGQTLVRVVQGEEKRKVVKGEIIQSNIESSYFTANGFQEVQEKVKSKKK